MKTILLLAILGTLSGAAHAHQDRHLSLLPDASIPELPAQYASTRVQIQFTEGASGELRMLKFTSSGREIEIKACLLKLVRSNSLQQVSLSGSWYHERSLLPHYVSIQFNDPDGESDLPEDPRLQFLFSLVDASVIEVTKVVALPKKGAVQMRPIALKNGCPYGAYEN